MALDKAKKDNIVYKDPVKTKTVERVLVRAGRVDQKKKEGFKVIGTGKDARGKILGVRTHADDLVLMEK